MLELGSSACCQRPSRKVGALDDTIFKALTAAGVRVEDHVVSQTESREPGEPVPRLGRHLWQGLTLVHI
jgi:hypothetical protein